MSPDQPTSSAYVPRSVILGKLAKCRDQLDDRVYKREFLPRKRSVQPCPVCSTGTHKGFLTCKRCRGSGRVKMPKFDGVRIRYMIVMCPTCRQHGYQGCGACFALGYGSREITRKEKKALKDLALSAAHPMLFKQPLDTACVAVEKLLQRVEEGATLNYLRAVRDACYKDMDFFTR